MQNKKIVIPSIFALLLITLFLVFGATPRSLTQRQGLEANQRGQ